MPRPVPQQMAPERCVEMERCVSPEYVTLVGLDLTGTIRVKVELHRADVSAWWVKVIRHWLAWQHGACDIRIVS